MNGPNRSLARHVLADLIADLTLLDSASRLSDRFFLPGHELEVFRAISAAREDRLEAVDFAVLIEKMRGADAGSWLGALMEGHPAPTREAFVARVDELAKQFLKREILKAAEQEAKSAEFDLARIRPLLDEYGEIERGTVGPAVQPLSSIEARPIEWLWHGRIPFGMLSLVAGAPGQGKSFLVDAAITAALSRGRPLPDSGDSIQCSSLILAAEDPIAQSVRPRADANDADCNRIFVLSDQDLDLGTLMTRLGDALEANPDIRLVILDPLNSYLKSGVDNFRDPETRRALLRPLAALAEKTGAAVCGIVHMRKSEDGGALARVAGSLAYTAVARSVLAVAADPDDEGRKLILPLKSNYCRRPLNLAFRIDPSLRVTFEAAPDVDAEDVLGRRDPEEEGLRVFAVEWLRGFLCEPKTLRETESAARLEHISRSVLFKARQRLKVVSRTSGFGPGRTVTWELPS